MNSYLRYRSDIVLVGVLLFTLLIHVSSFLSTWSLTLLIGAALIGLVPVLWSAVRSFREGEWASMDTLASFALLFSLLTGEWVSAVFIELMLAAARILNNVTTDRAEQSIRGLLKLRPETALIERAGSIQKMAIKDIVVGDIMVADVGERIPVDGVVLSGDAAIDESSLTGESLPVTKTIGSTVLSSTLLQSGNLRIRVTHVGRDTALERVIRLVEKARAEKPTIQTLGERFGKLYLISIFVGSTLIFLLTHNILLVLSVVLVVCADDVAVAIPIAYLRAIRSAASRGIIIKGSRHLETLGQIHTLIFDKTGTLTTGSMSITECLPSLGISRETVIRAAALAAIRSSHPLSLAFLAYAKQSGFGEEYPDTLQEYSGKGVVIQKDGQTIVFGKKELFQELHIPLPPELLTLVHEKHTEGQSVSLVALDGKIIGTITASDKIKKHAEKSLAELRVLGIKKIVMLTGDNEVVAQTIAQKLGLDEWHSNLLPEDKVHLIKQYQAKEPVIMVGDGINDAAALSIANVGIAMGGLGMEGTIESAQIILMHDNLNAIPTTIRLAHMTKRISVQDFWIWGSTNILGLALVFGSFIGPPGAAAYNFISDFFPLFNSLRARVKR